MKAPVALAGVFVVLAAWVEPTQEPLFEQAVATYRQGNVQGALAQLRQISIESRADGIVRTIGASRQQSGRINPVPLEAALALITEDAFVSEQVVACGGLVVMSASARRILQADDAIGLLQKDASQDQFVRTWYLAVMSHDQGQAALSTAEDCFNAAPERIRAHPEMLLSLGALHEFGWWRGHEDDATMPGFSPDLGRAERAYEAAAAADPGLQEARLRLGRVLGLRDKAEESIATLSPIVEHGDPGFAYLARLFQGELHERRKQYDEASASYAAAVALMPFAQSAKVALAQLAHRQGRRSDAATRARDLASATRASDSADPWFWYYKGTAWRTESYVLAFRAIVQRPQ